MPEKPIKLPIILILAAVGVAALLFLYFCNPADIPAFPRCPFYSLTGYKCPGCGTLRGMHALLHLKVREAWGLNPFMVALLPVLLSFVLKPRLTNNVWVGWGVLVSTVLWWILRNVAGI